MGICQHLQLFYFLYFSKPVADRAIHRAVRRRRVQKILELGIGSGQRAVRMIQVARASTPARQVEFIGIDWFEDRPATDSHGPSLKAAYQMLRRTGAKVRLIPGEPLEALCRDANEIGQVDLLLFSAGLAPEALSRTWFFIPRLLHPRSLVYVEKPLPEGQTTYQVMVGEEVQALAAAVGRRAA